jgi:DNA-binding NarL/FixJ family response regulator
MITSPSNAYPTRSHPLAAGSADGLIRVLIVDDHPAVRFGIRRLIDDQPDLLVVGEASSATEALGGEAQWSDVAVVDCHLGAKDGLWLTRRLKGLARPPRVLVYSAFADGALVVAAIVAGADGLLSKGALGQELCINIRKLHRGRQALPRVTSSIVRAMRSRLEPRDRSIFGMLIRGVEPALISERLAISPPELEARRSAMVRALAPPRTRSWSFARARAPLDYERPRRRPRH